MSASAMFSPKKVIDIGRELEEEMRGDSRVVVYRGVLRRLLVKLRFRAMF